MHIANRILAFIALLIGLALEIGGIWLIALDGSPYYAVAGAAYMVAGVLIWRHQASGAWLMVLMAAGTAVWALWESGTDYWALFPRLLVPFALVSLGLLLVPAPAAFRRHKTRGLGALGLLGTLAFFGFAFVPHGVVSPSPDFTYQPAPANTTPSNWYSYGRTNAGTRYAPFTQINRDNVNTLELAWTYRTGWEQKNGGVDSNTPLQIHDKLYSCTPSGKISAINADTGKEIWSFQAPGSSPVWNRCRGLAFSDSES